MQKYYTVKQLCDKYSLNQQRVRNWINNSERSGFSKCVYRIGRNIIICPTEFEKWATDIAGLGNIFESEVASKEEIEKYLILNKRILELSDEKLEDLFENSIKRSIEEQRVFTAGIIEALESVLDSKEIKSLTSSLEEMIEEKS